MAKLKVIIRINKDYAKLAEQLTFVMVMSALSYHLSRELCVPSLGMLKVKPEVSNNCTTKNINMQNQLEAVYCVCSSSTVC